MTKKIYFISDLHLGAAYITDPRAHEMRIVRFLDSIAHDAAELIMLGDVLDYWFEYRTVVPRGYVRFFGALARLADSGVKITWFIGNHDIWLFDYVRDEIGLRVVDGFEVRDINGLRFFLSHGDGVGKLPTAFRTMRALFRNRFCQRLYAAIHPRWTIPFAHAWSRHSRATGDTGSGQSHSSEPLVGFCNDYLTEVDPTVNYFIFGHHHVLVDQTLCNSTSHMIIIGDWLSHFSYAELNGQELSLKIFH